MKRFFVLFVCTGNICRSPMAEGILKDLVLDEVSLRRAILPIDVASAGIGAPEGRPASRYAVAAAAEYGIDLGFHRARQLTENIVRNSDLILTMAEEHTHFITQLWPDVTHVSELRRYGSGHEKELMSVDIEDPMGFGLEVYRDIFKILQTEIRRVADDLFPFIFERNEA